MICLITGGARSGKSTYAQKEALRLSANPVYVATAKYTTNDPEFSARVQRHKEERNEQWINYEEPLYVSGLALAKKIVVIDCVTLWLSNFFSLLNMNVGACLQGLQKEIDTLSEIEALFFIVTNEIGMGVHADTEIGRRFTDLQGWANQYIAGKADKVILMVSGIPVIIKQKEHVI